MSQRIGITTFMDQSAVISFVVKRLGILALAIISSVTFADDTEKTDIAFVLRGYNGTTLYPTIESFRPEAILALAGLSKLSFGKASTFEIFDGGIDVNDPVYYGSLVQIEVIDAALAGWVGTRFAGYLTSSDYTGDILVDPSEEEIAVLESLRAWLVENRVGAYYGWKDTALGAENWTWVIMKVLRIGGSAAHLFLNEVRVPTELDANDFKAIGVIFSSTDEYNASAAATICTNLGIKDANGQVFEEEIPYADKSECFYHDYSISAPDYPKPWEEVTSFVTIHEAIHAFGQKGHDRYIDGSAFPYSVMNVGGLKDEYPIWNRIYIHQWLSEEIITEDRNELTDYKDATDLSKKYLLRLSSKNDFEYVDGCGESFSSKRYQEIYNGALVQYQTPVNTPCSSSSNKFPGVRFESIKDVTDTTLPVVESTHVTNFVTNEDYRARDKIVISFSENIALGEGQVVLLKDALPIKTVEVNQIPSLTSSTPNHVGPDLQVSGKTLTIWFRTNYPNPQYSVRFGPGAIIDWGGNQVIGQHCAAIDRADVSADADSDGVSDCADVYPLDAAESADTDVDGVGNNADADDDGDGVADVADAFPLNASESIDTDGDGIGDNSDWAPLDSSESLDTDLDGIGNNADIDDDNDTVLDGDDTFPLDATESVDTDGDSVGDNSDWAPNDSTESADTDGDGLGDNTDAFPTDATETLDADGDGVGDNSDWAPNDSAESSDIDGDGVGDNADAFPADATETLDTDGDGDGNNKDDDDDGDGIVDDSDALPLDSSETLDTDLDGTGNNADADDDNDGVSDADDTYPLISLGALTDSDGDGIPNQCDSDCLSLGMNPDDDDDNDTLSDITELAAGTSPIKRDTDFDSLSDKFELESIGRNAIVSDYDISSGANHTCVSQDDGISCWGMNQDSQLDVPANLKGNVQLELGSWNSCALKQVNGEIVCWGGNNADSKAPVGSGYEQIAVGGSHTCALKNGLITCAGFDAYGQATPPEISGVLKVVAGSYHSCALTNTAVHCWGAMPQDQPVDVPELTNPSNLFSSNNTVCAMHDDGLRCWGQDDGSGLLTPPALLKSAEVSIGRSHACAINGTQIKCWGSNYRENTSPPVLTNPVQVAIGGIHSCALSDEGVTCWGDSRSNRTAVPTNLIFGDFDKDGNRDNVDLDDDGDGVSDSNDVLPLDPTNDSDNDGVANNADAYPENSLYSKDSDNDGMPDAWEIQYGLNPNDASDVTSDTDNDGVSALDEFLAGTIPSGSLDIDGNGQYDALTDGLLLLRGMFGLDGSALVTGTIASDAAYTESVDVESRIATLGDLADIDGNGQIDALTDGLLTLRYLFGLEGETLIAGVVASDATRTTAVDIEAHLKTLMPTL